MGFFSQGLRMMLDAQERYLRAGLDVFLRVANFPSSGDIQDTGLALIPSPSSPLVLSTGFTDILIDPPPEVMPIQTKNIGLDAAKIMFGSMKFLVSATFVDSIRDQYPNVLTSYGVFRSWDGMDNNSPGTQTASVIGIVYGDFVYSIENIGRTIVGDRPIIWQFTCNAMELYLPTASSEAVPHDQF